MEYAVLLRGPTLETSNVAYNPMRRGQQVAWEKKWVRFGVEEIDHYIATQIGMSIPRA
jgi:hypothetical protein